MRETRLRRFLLYTLSASALLGLVFLVLRFLLPWMLPFLLAFAAAGAMEPAIRFLQRRLRLRRSFCALLMTLLLLFLVGGILSLLGTTLLSEADSLLGRAPVLLERLGEACDALLARIRRGSAALPLWLQEYLESALPRRIREAGDLLSTLAGQLLTHLAAFAAALPRGMLTLATGVLALYYIAASYPSLCDTLRSGLPPAGRRALRILRSGLARSLSHWLRAQLTLCSVTFFELLAAFVLLHQSYALLLALLITLVDALPVFGTGTVLLPWALLLALLGEMPRAVALALLYLLTMTVRSVLEPRLLGARAGLPPVFSLLAMYLGYCAFGIGGMILCPFLLLLASQLRPLLRQDK